MKPMQRDRSNICIDHVHPDETDALLRLYIDLFYDREPLTKCLGLSRDRMISFARSIYGGANSSPMSKGFCWVARDRHAADKKVGFIVCDDPAVEGNQLVPEDISEKEKEVFSAVMALMGEVRKPVQDRIGSEAGKCLHVAAVGVAPGYEGKGIATKLLQTALEHATAREFTHLFAECTSTGSRRCHEKLGFQCLHSVAVGAFSVDGARPFAQNNLDIYLLWKDLTKRSG
jgi:ribosomal protein S18 acetylase RimI-like enzyme